MKNYFDELIVSQSENVHLAICAEASQICLYRRAKFEIWIAIPTRKIVSEWRFESGITFIVPPAKGGGMEIIIEKQLRLGGGDPWLDLSLIGARRRVLWIIEMKLIFIRRM